MSFLSETVGGVLWYGLMFTGFGALGLYTGHAVLGYAAGVIGILLLALTLFTVCWITVCYLRTHRR